MTGSKEITAVCIPTYDEHLVKSLDDILDIIDKTFHPDVIPANRRVEYHPKFFRRIMNQV